MCLCVAALMCTGLGGGGESTEFHFIQNYSETCLLPCESSGGDCWTREGEGWELPVARLS